MDERTDSNQSFENIKHIDENGIEFWYAREMMKILEYNKWENFEKVINKAMRYFEQLVCEDKLLEFYIYITLRKFID